MASALRGLPQEVLQVVLGFLPRLSEGVEPVQGMPLYAAIRPGVRQFAFPEYVCGQAMKSAADLLMTASIPPLSGAPSQWLTIHLSTIEREVRARAEEKQGYGNSFGVARLVCRTWYRATENIIAEEELQRFHQCATAKIEAWTRLAQVREENYRPYEEEGAYLKWEEQGKKHRDRLCPGHREVLNAYETCLESGQDNADLAEQARTVVEKLTYGPHKISASQLRTDCLMAVEYYGFRIETHGVPYTAQQWLCGLTEGLHDLNGVEICGAMEGMFTKDHSFSSNLLPLKPWHENRAPHQLEDGSMEEGDSGYPLPIKLPESVVNDLMLVGVHEQSLYSIYPFLIATNATRCVGARNHRCLCYPCRGEWNDNESYFTDFFHNLAVAMADPEILKQTHTATSAFSLYQSIGPINLMYRMAIATVVHHPHQLIDAMRVMGLRVTCTFQKIRNVSGAPHAMVPPWAGGTMSTDHNYLWLEWQRFLILYDISLFERLYEPLAKDGDPNFAQENVAVHVAIWFLPNLSCLGPLLVRRGRGELVGKFLKQLLCPHVEHISVSHANHPDPHATTKGADSRNANLHVDPHVVQPKRLLSLLQKSAATRTMLCKAIQQAALIQEARGDVLEFVAGVLPSLVAQRDVIVIECIVETLMTLSLTTNERVAALSLDVEANNVFLRALALGEKGKPSSKLVVKLGKLVSGKGSGAAAKLVCAETVVQQLKVAESIPRGKQSQDTRKELRKLFAVK